MSISPEQQQQLFEAAKLAHKRSYSPYSNYAVGSAILASDGVIYPGCNVENAAYPSCQCAEANAIGHMVSVAGKSKILALCVVVDADEGGIPCGGCRQQINEFASGDCPIIIGNLERIVKTLTLKDILPHSFGPEHLS